jgi:uncharacterized protein (DUF302 family)
MQSPYSWRLRAPSFLQTLRTALGAVALWIAICPAGAADLGHQAIAGSDYDTVRQALVEAIEAEGLVPGPVSHFGEMLERTDASLHHGSAIYAQAEVFSFCSVAVAAQLVREDPERIADCPMTIALYRLKDSGEVRIAYRGRDGSTPGAKAANELLRRIVERTTGMLPHR